MRNEVKFSRKCAKEVGEILGLDWTKIDFEQFYMGINIELEHGTRWGDKTNVTNDNPVITGRIALAHLYEIPDYYTRLDEMEKKAEKEMEKHKKKEHKHKKDK